MSKSRGWVGLLSLVSLFVLTACPGYENRGGWVCNEAYCGPTGPGNPWYPANRLDRSSATPARIDSVARGVSESYGISEATARIVIEASLGQNTVSNLEQMGLTAAEAAGLLSAESPSREILERVSVRLGEDSARLEALLNDYRAH